MGALAGVSGTGGPNFSFDVDVDILWFCVIVQAKMLSDAGTYNLDPAMTG